MASVAELSKREIYELCERFLKDLLADKPQKPQIDPEEEFDILLFFKEMPPWEEFELAWDRMEEFPKERDDIIRQVCNGYAGFAKDVGELLPDTQCILSLDDTANDLEQLTSPEDVERRKLRDFLYPWLLLRLFF